MGVTDFGPQRPERWRLAEQGMLAAAFVAVAVAAFVTWQTTVVPRSSASVRPVSGPDSLLILVVSSTCPACTDEEGVERIRSALVEIAAARAPDSRLRLMGVAVDHDPEEGMELLRRLGPFEEIAVGGGWVNLAFSDIVWNDTAGIPAVVPQLLLLVRTLEVELADVRETSRSITSLAFGSDSVMARLRSSGFTGVR